ncbi:mycothiol synthase [Nocardioides piscis]|uniref:Mycothiol acetyltransferase n=1 Tax=Nocardioides piscis TaxID=2714938 RepID=A0A6G7YEH2_9ACTN|nr:mycothiol synthase [Nocardioides piscis]QIK75205.1 mycothiol synthase [Nocardioides piscis]
MNDLLERVSAIAAAAEAADGAAPLDEATWLWLRAGLGEGESAAVDETGFLLRRGSEVHLVVHPDHRGRGLGARRLAGVEGPAQAWSHGNHPAAARLAARFGFDRVRDLWVMRRAMSEPLPPGSGVGIRPFAPGDEPELLRVNAAAFAAHPEQGALDVAGLAARMAEPWFDPAGLLVAMDGPRMLGFHWTKQHSPELGEVYVVGIDPAAQGRGLGSALTLAGLHHLAGLGVSETILYVEADNHVARSTYARLGFTHADTDTHVLYRRIS